MGQLLGKFRKKKTKSEDETSRDETDLTEYEKQLNILRKLLTEKTEIFILNNLLLSVQFFENYDREIKELRLNPVSEKESQLNDSLKSYQKHVLLPDRILELVNKRVRYRPLHGPNKTKSQPLAAQRMFVFHDNMEVIQNNIEVADYSVVGGPIHVITLDYANTQGYVVLERIQIKYDKIEDDNSRKSSSELDESKTEKTVRFERNPTITPLQIPTKSILNKNPLSPSPIKKLQSPSPLKEVQFNFDEPKILRSSSATNLRLKDKKPVNAESKRPLSFDLKNIQLDNNGLSNIEIEDEDEYDYTTITRLSTTRSLEEVREGIEVQNISKIPNKCFEKRDIKKALRPEDLSDDEDEFDEFGKRRPPIKKKPIQFYETKYFVNSQKFFAHFGDVFEQIYSKLGFTKEAKIEALSQGSIIYINDESQDGFKIGYEVYPAIITPWPDIANEWAIRERKNYLCEPAAIQWPRKVWIKKIRQTIGGAALPIGHIPKRGTNVDFELEWSVAFPGAERFLDLHMTHAQIRCYLFILALYKTYMELPDIKLGLQPYHIKTVIFWECEKNWTNWQEQILGDKLNKILTLLYECLAQARLPDYFNRKKNLFSDIPRKYLLISQQKLHKILENPVLYTLIALRNLRYTSGKFFPPLDYKTLYKILSVHDAFTLDNPKALNVGGMGIRRDFKEEKEVVEEEMNEFKENKKSFWTKQADMERLWLIKSRQQYENSKKQKQENLQNQRKESVDSINIDLNCKDIKFDENRIRKILEFFINHYIEMAKYSIDFESFYETRIYMSYSHLLRTLLMELPSGQIIAEELLDKLVAVTNKYEIAIKRFQQSSPELPVRNRRHSDVSYIQPSTSKERIRNESISEETKNETATIYMEVQVDVHNKKENSDNENTNDNPSEEIENEIISEVENKKEVIEADVHHPPVLPKMKTLQELLKEEIEELIENKEIPVIDALPLNDISPSKDPKQINDGDNEIEMLHKNKEIPVIDAIESIDISDGTDKKQTNDNVIKSTNNLEKRVKFVSEEDSDNDDDEFTEL